MTKDIEPLTSVTVHTWRDRNGIFHPVEYMETRHLYYTLLMIWNHSAPEHLKYRPFNEYTFSSFYTVEYFIDTVRAMMKEIQTRELPKNWYLRLVDMSKSLQEYESKIKIPYLFKGESK